MRVIANRRFAPESGQIADMSACPLSAISDLTHRSKDRRDSTVGPPHGIAPKCDARHILTAGMWNNHAFVDLDAPSGFPHPRGRSWYAEGNPNIQ